MRTKSDLRFWETVTDQSTSLSWMWEGSADSARLSFSNRLTHAVSTLDVNRVPGERSGCCAHPISPETEEALVAATLIQYADGAEIVRGTAELAYVPGAAGRTLTVRTKTNRSWVCVETPRLAAFDAGWWNVAGSSGYEVMWRTPTGRHLVQREFDGAGVVDEVVLKFGMRGFGLLIR